MIDADSMQERIRAANPVPGSDQLDPDEIARFVALAEQSRTPDVVEAESLQRQSSRRRGPLVAIASAAVALGAVALAVVLVGAVGGGDVPRKDPASATPGETATTLRVPDPAPYAQRLVPHPVDNPPPISTAIGDLEFEMLQFDSPVDYINEVAWTKHGLVSLVNDRLYWSTDYYNWESIGPVDGDKITVTDNEVIVHGGPESAVRYGWDGEGWVEVGTVLAAWVDQFAFGASSAVAVSGDTFFFSTDGMHFTRAEHPPLVASEQGWCPEGWGLFHSDPFVLATGTGYVALVPTATAWWFDDPVCESVVWTSVDGNQWELLSTESPFGEKSGVYAVVERDGRFVAAGAKQGEAAVMWVSDDGLSWELIEVRLTNIDGIAAGDMGWIITGWSWRYDYQVMMFSADGITWDGPYECPRTLTSGYLPAQMAVGDDVIFGISGGVDISGSPGALVARLQG